MCVNLLTSDKLMTERRMQAIGVIGVIGVIGEIRPTTLLKTLQEE